ncbi:GNAT family N-acetyltransferase [Frondihabitans cladoniiphilus]|uniref:GNAT family N-acetyltransferase n=1 Tax=Frondihabitans cladoniiphilus TaxID=715785 RepID=A0ABP8W0K1_9MICO
MLTFRPATAADTSVIVDLVTSAYRGEASTAGWTTEAHLIDGVRITPELLQHDLDNPAGLVLLGVEGDGTVVTCCNLVARDARVGYFGMFAVSPARQGEGLGKVVLAEAERLLRDEWSCTTMEMTVLDQRPELVAFYERRGFVRTGTFEEFPYGDERFGTPRVAGLRLAVLRKPLEHPAL